MTRKIAVTLMMLLALSGTAATLSACNTAAGAGQDMKAGGQSLENSAERNKSY